MENLLNPELLRIGLLAAVSTYGVTQAIKPYIKKFSPDSIVRTSVRLGALAIGALWGLALQMDAQGAIVGVSGAALSTVIVGVLKKKIAEPK